jgi:hypothetical protein
MRGQQKQHFPCHGSDACENEELADWEMDTGAAIGDKVCIDGT